MKLFYFLHFAFLIIPSLTYSQQTNYKNQFGFRSDNDAYLAYGQDRYYTNGLFISFRRATDQSKLVKKLNKVIWEIEGGHKMYNPISGNIINIADVDRPFTAYLYGEGSINLLFNSENALKVSLQAGTIGPDAKGKEVQEFLHNIVGFYEIKGWEYQLNNETAINTTVDYKHFLHRSGSGTTDFTINSHLNLGNTFSGASLGVMFRAGDLRQLFHSASTESVISNKSSTQDINEKEFFFYANPMLHYVAYDATIQGGLFRNDKGPVTFDVKPLVFSQQAGLIYSKNRWTADFSVTFNSREVRSTAKPHQYGSAAFYYSFN